MEVIANPLNPRCRYVNDRGEYGCDRTAVYVIVLRLRKVTVSTEILTYRMCRLHKDLIVAVFEAEGHHPTVIAGCPKD